jgi:hypothetical protein
VNEGNCDADNAPKAAAKPTMNRPHHLSIIAILFVDSE